MKKILIAILVFFAAVSAAFSYNITCEKGMEKYTDTVKDKLGALIESVSAAREEAMGLLGSQAEIADEMAYLMGCEDKKDLINVHLGYDLYDSKIILDTLKNVKILPYEETSRKGELKAGYISYEFTENGGVNIVFSSMVTPGEESDFYLPVLINKNGEIVKLEELSDGIMGLGGNTSLKAPMIILNIVNVIMKDSLKIDYPFGRWFNEGMNYKITSLILHKVNYAKTEEFDRLFRPSEESIKNRDKVSLWGFIQRHLVLDSEYIREKENAEIQFSCQLADDLYAKCGREGFHKIFTEMKYSDMLTNPQICKMIEDQTGTDMKGLMDQYIPENVRSLTDTKKLDETEKQAQSLMDGKKYKEAVPLWENVLSGDPYRYNARLNLARCFREEKDIVSSDKEIFIAANTMSGKVTINIYGEENEQVAVILGKYLFMSEDFEDAYDLLKIAYEKDKGEDIRKMLDAIEMTKENMRKELYGGE